jgi:hypothetical protein
MINVIKNAIEEIQSFVKRVANNQEAVKPGTPVRFTEASTVRDRIWQGDLALTVVASVPKDYKKVEKLSEVNRQLVVGNTEGAKHCLKSLNGVDVYLPPVWNEESLKGPVLVCNSETTVLHPTHGDVTVPAGFIIECTYQREYDKELERERRARD